MSRIRFVESPGWGPLPIPIAEAVCEKVVSGFGGNALNRNIDVVYDERGPLVTFDRLRNRVTIGIDVRGPYWAQLTMRFAHAYARVLMNSHCDRTLHWLAAALVEAASLYALRQWRAPYPTAAWRAVGAQCYCYANSRMAHPDRRLPIGEEFVTWFERALPTLESGSLRHTENAIVAARVLPVFEEAPISWQVLRYLTWPRPVPAVQQLFTRWDCGTPQHLRRHLWALRCAVLGEGIQS